MAEQLFPIVVFAMFSTMFLQEHFYVSASSVSSFLSQYHRRLWRLFLQEHFFSFPERKEPTGAKVGMNISSRYGNEGGRSRGNLAVNVVSPFSFPTLVMMWIDPAISSDG